MKLADIAAHAVYLTIIEWGSATNRSLYLCTERGFPLAKVEDRRFHVGSFQFSAYLKTAHISHLQKEGTIDVAEMDPAISEAITEAQ